MASALAVIVRLQASLDLHHGWNIELDLRDAMAVLRQLQQENVDLRAKLAAATSAAAGA